MSNGLFAVDGIDVAGLVAEHLGPRVLPATLHKAGAVVARGADSTAGRTRGPSTPHRCRGFVEDFSSVGINPLIQAGDRKVTLLGATIEGGAEPEGGDVDSVTIEGRTLTVHRVVSRDPAGATFVLQCR